MVIPWIGPVTPRAVHPRQAHLIAQVEGVHPMAVEAMNHRVDHRVQNLTDMPVDPRHQGVTGTQDSVKMMVVGSLELMETTTLPLHRKRLKKGRQGLAFSAKALTGFTPT